MRRSEQGFTLIEVLVVTAITGMVTTFLLLSFSTSRRGLDESVTRGMAQIREVQSWAASGKQYQNTYRCGYGIRQNNATQAVIYVGPNSTLTDCSVQDRNYDASDLQPYAIVIPSAAIEFKENSPGVYFQDIFFEPPDPKTYINNNSALNAVPQRILLGIKGKDCSDARDCRAICVYTSGRIEVQYDLTCP